MIVVHRAERADRLVEALADLLACAPADPMTEEIVAVPTRGVERWVAQRLSHRLGATGAGGGVCANVAFPFPGSMVEQATAIACGFDPELDPWPPDRSVWPLLELVDDSLTAPWLEPLVAHLKAGSPEHPEGTVTIRRFAVVRHLADLYDRYAVHRPDMVQRWAEGLERSRSTRSVTSSNGPGGGRDDHWQARLWRRLRRRIGIPSPAERLATAVTRLEAEPHLLDLPPRLSLFGLTRLPASHLRVLEAIGRNRDVHLFLLHPSGVLWEAIEAAAARARARPSSKRSDDSTVVIAANPLLRSWGRDAREMQLVLRSRGVEGGEHLPMPEPPPDGRCLLRLLQADVRANRAPGEARRNHDGDPRPALDPADDSLRVHACHGQLRQVEVMRDAILHLLADDPSLEPSDVLVMCPDIESFAPLVRAVFGSGDLRDADDRQGEPRQREPGPPQLRVRLADRSLRQTNPVLALAAQLLELAAGRVTASEVLDLAGREPVARRFGFGDDELGRLERWVVECGIRWGLDEAHRVPWGLDQVGDGTWQAGLNRLLLGVAMTEEGQRLVAGILPLDDVPSSEVDLAGRFVEFVERLQAAIDRLRGPHTVGDWAKAIAEAVESLSLPPPREPWQREQLRRLLDDVVGTAMRAADRLQVAADTPRALLDLAEVRALLDGRLRGRPTRASFRTGDLTFCTLVPMRSVPHRVVGLLGLDEDAFPRHPAHDGDDLLLAEPHVGDWDPRSEDRQLLLDALLAATEHLIVTYQARDPRTNQERAPCVPVAELLDVVDRTVRVPDGSPHLHARAHVVVEHPLQSFDRRNFVAGGLAGDQPWSFDPVDLAGARALVQPRREPRPFLSRPLDRLDAQTVQLDALVRFLEHPVRAFLRERLGWYGTASTAEVKDALPVALDALERWGVGDRMLGALLAGATMDEAQAAELGRGLLPPGELAAHELREIKQTAASLAGAARRWTAESQPASIEVAVRLTDGRTLIGTVPDVYSKGASEDPGAAAYACIVRCVYSQLGPKHRLAAWARFLALSAAHPEQEVSAVTIGRSAAAGRGPRVATSELPPLGSTPEERVTGALSALAVLVDLYDRGMCEPLPLPTKTSEKCAEALRDGKHPRSACRTTWDAGTYVPGEAADPEHVLVLGGETTIDDLLAERARGDECGPGWASDPSRFVRLARRLWEPLLAHERLEQREHLDRLEQREQRT